MEPASTVGLLLCACGCHFRVCAHWALKGQLLVRLCCTASVNAISSACDGGPVPEVLYVCPQLASQLCGLKVMV